MRQIMQWIMCALRVHGPAKPTIPGGGLACSWCNRRLW